MELVKDFGKMWKGVLFALAIAVPAWLLGKRFEVIGGPVFAILMGMALALVIPRRAGEPLTAGVKFTSKKVLQWAVILLGFGLNLGQIAQVGAQSLPIIVSTIATSLIVAFVLCRALNIPARSRRSSAWALRSAAARPSRPRRRSSTPMTRRSPRPSA